MTDSPAKGGVRRRGALLQAAADGMLYVGAGARVWHLNRRGADGLSASARDTAYVRSLIESGELRVGDDGVVRVTDSSERLES